MEENKSLEPAFRGQVDSPTMVPVSSYPVEVETEGTSPALVEYWRVLRKRRWMIISILAFVVGAAMIATLKQRPVYQAKAVIQIDRGSPNVLNFQDFMAAEMNPYDDSYLETAYRVLQSRSLAYRVIRKLGLASSPEFAGEPNKGSPLGNLWQNSSPTLSPEEQLDPKFTSVINSYLENLRISPVRRSQLVEISFESQDPSLSARVANAVAADYIEMNLEAKWEATQKASDWLSKQLVGMKGKLEKSEEDLQRYAKDNSILFLDEKQSMNSQKLQLLQEEATQAQADLIRKESFYKQVKDGDYSSVPGILENRLYQDLSLKLADLRREYSDLTATFTPEYPRVQRLKGQIDETQAILERERKAFVQRATSEYQAAANRKRLLDQAVVQQTRDFNSVAEKSIQYNILKREADTNRQLYDGLLQRMKEAGVSASLRASNVRVVDPAEVPLRPSRPRPFVNFGLSLMVGLSLGIGFAFLQEYLDNTLKTSEDVQRYLRLPTLGVIPAALTAGSKVPYGQVVARRAPSTSNTTFELANPEGGNGKAKSLQVMGGNGNFAVAEAYRSLRTSVLLSSSEQPPRVILITSGHPGEGKTTTAVNLAITLVQLGSRVLVIDSDMRRPQVSTLLQLQKTVAGLSTFLTGQLPLEQVIASTSIPGLWAIPCGPIPPNPAELLSSRMMRRLLDEASQKFDYVILDSPPTLHVTDARILSSLTQAVVLVAHGGETAREAVKHAKQHLQDVNANVIGVVLNKVDFSSAGYGYYNRYSKYSYDRGDQTSDSDLTTLRA